MRGLYPYLRPSTALRATTQMMHLLDGIKKNLILRKP